MNADPSPAGWADVKILLVDDEAAFLHSMRQSLQREFEVEVAASAAEAEQMMATRNYQVVVCDHLMPGEEGLHFLIRASDTHPRMKRILVTGYMNPELLTHNMELARLSACLLKPLKAEEIAQAIRKALAG